ncbi:sugar transferase [Nocardioides sp. Kera G14]|uniref:sugar transferase n=1 Tax=Nocardioides sp. Kera G14 TaxID=2884264 RepID=UPI001D125091|nr:sugar transferase [Nocardioides sp. Kera G14]UDY22869.1 sugar transferase [Nocardioides sp. Kera G14]
MLRSARDDRRRGFAHIVGPAARARWAIKRTMDVVAATAALVVLAPLLVVLAIAVRVDSPGPILFRQHRVGRHGRLFWCLKFRTMVTGAEALLPVVAAPGEDDGNGVLFKLKDDPRVTRVGRVLRRWSLDELPQLFNVLRGDMSLVGPRPALPSEVALYCRDMVGRHQVRPGLTGPWQVSGRSELDYDQSKLLDLGYVTAWTLRRDFLLLARTVAAVISGRGAY